jgi:endoglucanase
MVGAPPQLTARGNRIINADSGEPVLLRGVNRSGLEYSGPDGSEALSRAGLDECDFDEMICEWRANVIRLPFNQAWALERENYDPEPYLSALDFAVTCAARRGAYTLLDLHWLDASKPCGALRDGSLNYVPCLPNQGSIEIWRQLARRYRSEAAVLFDIFNEPHDPLPDDITATATRVTMNTWRPWAKMLIEAIRAEHPTALIFVPGVDWAFDLRGHPLEDMEGVVYSTHVYPGKGRKWDAAFGSLCSQVPVFAGEWGGTAEDLKWGRALLDYMQARQMGWTAWSWSDKPRLVERVSASEYRATAFGAIVKEALTSG